MRSPFRDPMDERCECGHPRRAHAHDLPWERSGGSHCRRNECPCQAFAPVVRTAKGTPVRRYARTGVGKLVGHHLYLHEEYALEAIARIKAWKPDVGLRLELALQERIKEFPAFRFHCLRLDLKDGLVRFDEAPDFDTAREPTVGRWLLVCHDGHDGHARRGSSAAIWHHRWAWVKPEYQGGWNVKEAEEWSRTYLSRLNECPSGVRQIWERQLATVELR